MPALVAELRERAPGVRLRVNEGASERLVTELVDGELAQAVVTEPVNDRRLVVEHLLDEDLVGLVARRHRAPARTGAARDLREPAACPPARSQPAAHRSSSAPPRRRGIALPVPVEVEGVRLLGDLVVAGAASILPETAIPPELQRVRIVGIADMPPRRLALVQARDAQLSLADQAVRDSVGRLVRDGT